MIDALRLKVKELKLKNEHNELKIKNLKKDIMMAEALELAKVSPAETYWHEKVGFIKHDVNEFSKNRKPDVIAAHEAGQEYGAEKYGPLLRVVDRFFRVTPCNESASNNYVFLFKEALQNLNHEPKEKPEIVGILLCGSRTQPGRGKAEFVFQFDNSVTLDSGQKYKLTPIKD